MGNSQSKTKQDISNRLFHDANNIYLQYDHFIKNDLQEDSNHINGGISSGTSSSEKFTDKNGNKINIWYDITFAGLLKGRYNLLSKWVDRINKEKKEILPTLKRKYDSFIFANQEQKDAFMRSREVLDEDLKVEDLKDLITFPKRISWNEKGKYMVTTLKDLLKKHGFRSNKDKRLSLFDLRNEKEGRCTSDLLTFLNCLKDEEQGLISNCDDGKNFHISISLSYVKKDQEKLYDEAKDLLEKEVKSRYIVPVKVRITEDMKKDDIIKLKCQWIDPSNINNPEIFEHEEEFDWEVTGYFLKDHEVGDVVELSDYDLPRNIRLKLIDIWAPIYRQEVAKLNKPNEFRKKYKLYFDIEDNSNFNTFIIDSLDDFIKERDEFEKNEGFEGYLLYKN